MKCSKEGYQHFVERHYEVMREKWGEFSLLSEASDSPTLPSSVPKLKCLTDKKEGTKSSESQGQRNLSRNALWI